MFRKFWFPNGKLRMMTTAILIKIDAKYARLPIRTLHFKSVFLTVGSYALPYISVRSFSLSL